MLNKRFQSISFRISFISAGFTLIVLVMMGLFINQQVNNYFTEQNQKQLAGKIQLIENLLQHSPTQFQTHLDEALKGHENLIVQIKNANGTMLYQSKEHYIDSNQIKPKNTSKWINWESNQHSYQGIIFDKTINLGKEKQIIEIIAGIETTDNFQFLLDFKQQLLWIGLIGMLCLMFLQGLTTWHGLKPIRVMAKISSNITAAHLSDRLRLDHIPLELIPLATAFNSMLNRLEASVEKLSAFSSDLAHEMRTPLNNLMMQTQVCLTKTRTLEEYQDVLFSNLEEYERLAKIVSDMLFLAKAEHRFNLKDLAQIQLEDEIETLFELYDAFAAERNIQLQYNGTAIVQADPSLLRRALSNLISNAIKYAEPNSKVEINAQSLETTIVLTLKNKLPADMRVITQTHLAKLFDRFYRLDSARQRTVDGTGLGLAISKSIIEMHQATIEAALQDDFILFKIIFKK